MLTATLLLAGLLLAYANGANDNFKGVATLFGCGATDFRRALAWATATTLAGSAASVVLAGELLKSFSGKGLVDPTLVSAPTYTAAVALGAAATVLVATRVGMPVSTTHALIGALLGAGVAAGSAVDGGRLIDGFAKPMLVSPLIAIVATVTVYPLLRRARAACGVTASTCLCAGQERFECVADGTAAASTLPVAPISIRVADAEECRQQHTGRVLGVESTSVLDTLHYISAGAVGFARGLNDTPKIAAILLAAPSMGGPTSLVLVGIMMATGGLLNARRVAMTMSQRITSLNPGQGFTANLLTSLIVIGASRLGLPVSTTHVSCGALFGIGATTGSARLGTIAIILVAWFTTLPLGGLFGAVSFWSLSAIASSQSHAPGVVYFPAEVESWRHDRDKRVSGVLKAERLRQRYLEIGPDDASPLERLSNYLIAFRDATIRAADKPDGPTYGCEGFDVSLPRIKEQLSGSTPLQASIFKEFEGKWHGVWGESPVNHDWRPSLIYETPLETAEGSPRLIAQQYAWIDNGFGWNYLAAGNGSDNRYVLGMVYYVNREKPGAIVGEKPHVGFRDGPSRLVWFTDREVFFEEVRGPAEYRDQHYVITAMYHDLFGGGAVSPRGTQAIYTRDPRDRPQFREFMWEPDAVRQ